MDRSAFLAGVRDVAPAVPANVPLGMLFGATAVQVGFDPASATALSLFGFAAVAQLTAVQLLQGGAALPVVLATIVLVNLRYVIYSATLVPKVEHLSRRWRAVIAYPLFDVNFALAEARFGEVGREEGHRGWYVLGTSAPVVVSFAASTTAGAVAGTVVGAGLHLEFAIPLVFIAVLVGQVDDASAVAAALVAGAASVVGAGLPVNLGLVVAAVVGTAVGVAVEYGPRRWSG